MGLEHSPLPFHCSFSWLASSLHTLTPANTLKDRQAHANVDTHTHTLFRRAAGRHRTIASCKLLSLVATCMALENKWKGKRGGRRRQGGRCEVAKVKDSETVIALLKGLCVFFSPPPVACSACLTVVTERVTCSRTQQKVNENGIWPLERNENRHKCTVQKCVLPQIPSTVFNWSLDTGGTQGDTASSCC